MSAVTHTRQEDGSYLVHGIGDCVLHGEYRGPKCRRCLADLAEMTSAPIITIPSQTAQEA